MHYVVKNNETTLGLNGVINKSLYEIYFHSDVSFSFIITNLYCL